jgi:Spy/CpxP family protein refolding chaperone
MTGKHLLIAATVTTALLISIGAYADNSMGGGQGMMGGRGHGMMGSGGNNMMDSDTNYSNSWSTPQSGKSPTDLEKRFEREQLRGEIRKKRQELSELYRSDKSDKALIDQKIAELNKLETDYERMYSEAN